MSLQSWAAAQPNRCQYGYAPAQHPGCCECSDSEWHVFVGALRSAAGTDGLIHQKHMRPLIQGIPHKHRGLLYRKARQSGVIELVGKEPSTDFAGGNGDKDSKVYRLVAA